jgi:hypothetical protein
VGLGQLHAMPRQQVAPNHRQPLRVAADIPDSMVKSHQSICLRPIDRPVLTVAGRCIEDTTRKAVSRAGLHRPCRARPADRSLVAEDRSARGVRDQTGPHPRSVLGPWRTGTTGARAVTYGHHRSRGTTGRRASRSGSSHNADRRIRLWSLRRHVTPSDRLEPVEAHHRTSHQHKGEPPPGIPIPAHLQPPPATQPRQRPLDLPAVAPKPG